MSALYEMLVREVIETIIRNNPNLAAIPVQQNARIPGFSGCLHQIDVYWGVEVYDMRVGYAIECKEYGRSVEIGQVRDFFGVLHDIGIRGAMVTTGGYQSGAKEFAKYYGVALQIYDPRRLAWRKVT
jgi:hypothetical protein